MSEVICFAAGLLLGCWLQHRKTIQQTPVPWITDYPKIEIPDTETFKDEKKREHL